MGGIKAIETVYDGYKFRSRLEARWTVFFNTLGIKYEYEPEGFDLGAAGWYLPDFWLSAQRMWIEIKPWADNPEDLYDVRHKAFSDALAEDFNSHMKANPESSVPYRDFYILAGDPYPYAYRVWCPNRLPVWDLNAQWTECPLCHRFELADLNAGYNAGTGEMYDGFSCEWCDVLDRLAFPDTDEAFFHKGHVFSKRPDAITQSPKLMAAYTTARQARFEHAK